MGILLFSLQGCVIVCRVVCVEWGSKRRWTCCSVLGRGLGLDLVNDTLLKASTALAEATEAPGALGTPRVVGSLS